MYEINKNGLIRLKIPRFIDETRFKRMMIAMVVSIGPNELFDIEDIINERAATVAMLIIANPKAIVNLPANSASGMIFSVPRKTIISPFPKIINPAGRLIIPIKSTRAAEYMSAAKNLAFTSRLRETGLVSSILKVPFWASPDSRSPVTRMMSKGTCTHKKYKIRNVTRYPFTILPCRTNISSRFWVRN
jgi:hypothetical protein